jgi:hypothetical protein
MRGWDSYLDILILLVICHRALRTSSSFCKTLCCMSSHLTGVVKSGRLGCGGHMSCRKQIFTNHVKYLCYARDEKRSPCFHVVACNVLLSYYIEAKAVKMELC